MSAIPPPRIIIDDTFGAAFIGALITIMLYGITTLQTYFYYVNYPDDGKSTKALVYAVWILDTAHVVLVSICMYHYLVTNYAYPQALAVGTWSLFVSVAINHSIAFVVQSFFTIRIFYLSSLEIRWWLVSFIGTFVVVHLVFGMETVGFLFVKKDFSRLHEITLFAAMPFAIFCVLSDVIIAATLCILLHGSKTDFRSTNTLLKVLMVYAINRCLLTSVVVVVEMIVFAVTPNSLWFLAIDFVVGKLYANSLLATLNSRHALQAHGSTVRSVHVSDLEFDDTGNWEVNNSSRKSAVIGLRPFENMSVAVSINTRQSVEV